MSKDKFEESAEYLKSLMGRKITLMIEAFIEGCNASAKLRMINSPPRDGRASDFVESDYKSFLQMLPPYYIKILLQHLPSVVSPWEVINMKNKEPTKYERLNHNNEAIATVEKTDDAAWSAVVNGLILKRMTDDGNQKLIWPTHELAMTACDKELKLTGVILYHMKHEMRIQLRGLITHK